jgi:hypothetical protein
MYAHADAYCIISNSRADAQIPAYMGNGESTHALCHDVSRVLSSVSLHSLVALEAAKGKVQLGVPVLVRVRALRPSAFLPWRRVAAWSQR